VDSQLGKADAIAATVHAMESGAPLVLGGWLPDDYAGGRTGRPDVLIKVAGGYLPADVKHHSTVKRANTTKALMSAVCICGVPASDEAPTTRAEPACQSAPSYQ
jgi:hypothetical protein